MPDDASFNHEVRTNLDTDLSVPLCLNQAQIKDFNEALTTCWEKKLFL